MDINNRTLHYIIRFLFGEDIPEGFITTVGYTNNRDLFERYNVVFIPSAFFSENVYGTEASLPTLPLQEIEGVPILFGTPEVESIDGTLVIHADLIASTYFLISRYEEIIQRETRDEYGRFLAKYSLPFKGNFLHRPVVDEYRLLLRKWLRQQGFNLPEIKNGIRKIYLTHDVDAPTLYRTWKGFIRSIRDKRGIRKSIQGKYGIVENDPYYTFPWLFEQDNRLCQQIGKERCQPILFTRSGGKCKQDKPHYRLQDKDIKKLLSSAHAHDITIGLHSSFQTGIYPDLIKKEKTNLEKHIGVEVCMNRHHFLSSREPEDMTYLEATGITDDFTMGYADCSGFRLGTCIPVRWINPVNRRLSSLTLHPLTIMDCSLEEKKYMGLTYEEAQSYCLRLIEQVHNAGGELTLLWHNSSVAKDNDSYLRPLYGHLLNILAQK